MGDRLGDPDGSRQQRKRQTRQALLEASRRLIRERGLAGITTRKIAEEAGVAAGTFFVHFPDMNTLVETLLDDHVGQALDDAVSSLPPTGGLVGELTHVARTLYESYDREPDLARQYLSASLFHADPEGPSVQRMRQFEHWVTRRTEQAVSNGEIPAIDPGLAFTAFFSLYFGILVGGLRGQLNRSEQITLLDSALRRLFMPETQS